MALGGGQFRQRAELTLGEAFGRDIVDTIKTGPRIFPSDDGGEFNELALGEVGAQGGVELVGDVGGRARQICGEAQGDFFDVVEIGAGLKSPYVLKLLLGDAFFPAHGRVNVDSKGTTDH
jgi:hypothetical protein